MSKRMLIDAQRVDETRVVVLDGERIDVVDYENDTLKQLKSNVYLARVTRVEPSLQAAFVDYGGNRHGFLPFSEIHPDYYQIPAEDRDKLIAEAAQRLAERQAARAKLRRDTKARAQKSDSQKATDLEDIDQADGPTSGDDNADADHTSRSLAERVDTGAQQRSAPFAAGIEIIDEGDQPLFSELIPNDPVVAGDGDDDDGQPVAAEAAGDLSTHQNAALDKAVDSVLDDVLSHENSDGDNDGNLADEAALDRDDLAALDGVESTDKDSDDEQAQADELSQPSAQDNLAHDTDHDHNDHDDDDDDDDDDLDEDEELEARAILRSIIAGRYKIQDVIKRRQVMVIQVSKEERGNKGAALTTYLSLAGRYCVLMPNTQRGGGISRKIANPRDRRKLKQILEELQIPAGVSVIVRTAGSERSKAEIRRDYEYLMRTWAEIRENTLAGQAPCLVYEEGNVIKRAVRDLYSRDMDEITVDGQVGYDAAKSFMRSLTPSHAKKVRLHKSSTPLFLAAGIEAQLDTLHDPVVPLSSGGYLVMNQTEALVAVDVNSGKATKERNIEDTALQTNLEAAAEVARQLRLRDMAGLVVIDFIDMDEGRHRGLVERKLRDAMKGDRARIQLGRISSFGLLELSRQRLRPSVFETSMQTCPTCTGTGLVRTDISFGRAILRRVEQLAQDSKLACEQIDVTVPFSVGLLVLNQLRGDLVAMEQRLGCSVNIAPDAHTDAPQFRVGIHADGRVQYFDEGTNKRESAGASPEARRGRGRRNERDRRGNERSDRSERSDRGEGSSGANRRNGGSRSANEDDVNPDTKAESDSENNSESQADGENRSNGRKRGGRNRKRGQSTAAPQADENADALAGEDQVTDNNLDASVDDDDEAKRKNRRRGKRGGRRRGRKEDEVATAEDNTSGVDVEGSTEATGADDSNTDAAAKPQDAPAEEEAAKPAKPTRAKGRPRSKAAKASTDAEPAVAEQPKTVTNAVAVAPPAVTSDKTVDASNAASQATATATALEDTPTKDGPKKRGWFNRAKDALTGK